MRGKIAKKIISILSAAVMAASNFMPVTAVGESAENYTTASAGESASGSSDLVYQSLELYPNGEDTCQVVTLDGMMPEGAEAEVVDVSDEHDGVAAYDITIIDGDSEYQPDDSRPILVEITDPVISESESIELWHILDSGEREQITEISVEDGKLRFFATGFSVYEIVEVGSENTDLADVVPKDIAEAGWQTLKSISSLANYGEGSSGLLISNADGFFATNVQIDAKGSTNRTGIKGTASSHPNDPDEALSDGAVYYFFESSSGNKYKMFCYDNDNQKKYVYNTGKSLALADSGSDFTASVKDNGFNLKATYSWQFEEKGKTDANQPDNVFVTGVSVHKMLLWYYSAGGSEEDPFKLNNAAPYGLMAYTEGNTIGTGLIADEDNNFAKMYGVETRDKVSGARKNVYVTENTDITEWKFTWVSGDKYKIYDAASNKYLKSDGTTLSMTDNADEATAFQVIPNAENATKNQKRIQLKDKANGKYISLNQNGFALSNSGTDLWFVKKATLADSQDITYTADRVSVSDGEKACDGQEIIIYTRIWNTQNECYDFYAIDYDGSLKRCYAYGDKLMWMGDSINTLLWKFIVHTENDKENGYYDFQNIYSGKYLNPQFTEGGSSVLSNSRPGVLLPGRTYEMTSTGAVNYGEYYSTILSWDSDDYSYAALANSGTSAAAAVKMSKACDYYFAVINPVRDDTADSLHKVATVDNYEYGISMKMVDFGTYNNMNDVKKNYPSATGSGNVGQSLKSTVTWDFFGGDNQPTSGLLKSTLNENGHPVVAKSKFSSQVGQDFETAFTKGASREDHGNVHQLNENVYQVNHLFIQSVHDSSGYFEYDSCQNFATLFPDGGKGVGGVPPNQQTDTNGRPLYWDAAEQKAVTDDNEGQNSPIYDFTVYRELGTVERENASNDFSTSKHGQFLPYNYLKEGVFAKLHPQNLYSVFAEYLKPDKGKLPEEDPRKYEKLYGADQGTFSNTDYYFGMELEAKFVQTPSGLDAWGHDVIFEFTGDDDFWLYVDGELVIDLGGIHSAKEGKVNFKTGKVVVDGKETNLRAVFRNNYITKYKEDHGNTAPTEQQISEHLSKFFEGNENIFKDYTEHTMKIYYMERGAGASNLHMRFNLSSVTPGNVIFAKELTAEEDEDLSNTDFSDVQFPFQIMYQTTDGTGRWYPLTDKTEENTPSVSYQYSTQTVRYAAEYKSPNADKTYNNVFFVTPGKPLEINFPEDAMEYQIIECAVNRDIYNVSSNSKVYTEGGTEQTVVFEEETVAASGNIKDLKMNAQRVKELPTISLNNQVMKNRVQALDITKKLYSNRSKSASSELYYSSPEDKTKEDKTTFNYRLYLSNGTSGELKLASLRDYYVLDPENRVCKWDSGEQKFVRYTSAVHPNGIYAYEITSDIREEVVTNTSPYGSISNIPAGYTVHVPGLLAGTKFMVVERDYEIPTGYDLIDYECKTGYKIINDNPNENNNFTLTAKALEWAPEEETKLLAVYKSGVLQPGYIREYSNQESAVKIEFDYEDSKAALASVKQYEVYQITVDKGNKVTAVADTAKHTLTAAYNWPEDSGTSGDKITVAVYDEQGKLMADHVAEIVFPNTKAEFSFNSDDSNINNYQVYEITVADRKKLESESNTELDLSYKDDNKYILDGKEYDLYPSSKKYYSAGTILEGIDAKLTVSNCRGFGIRADKVWSDADFATAHGDIYTAVYVDDNMLSNTLKRLESPNTTVQYFFEELLLNKHLSNYSIYEMEVKNPKVNPDGFVTEYSSLRKLQKLSGDIAADSDKIIVDAIDKIAEFTLRATKYWPERTADGTTVTVGVYDMNAPDAPLYTETIAYPAKTIDFGFNEAENLSKAASRYHVYEITRASETDPFTKGYLLDAEIIPVPVPMDYTVSYSYGTAYKTNDNMGEENARMDTIKNTRKGGIEINLHEWNNTDADDRPLEGGTFQLFIDVTDSMTDYGFGQLTEVTEGGITRYFKRLNTYISDRTGNVTVLYNFETGKYMLKQTAAPGQHIGIENPIFFEITEESGGVYNLTGWENANDTDDDRKHTSQDDGKFWAEYDIAPDSGVLTAIIDIYNKPYTFDVKKVNSVTGVGLGDAEFTVHREVMTAGGYAMEYNALEGYEDLVSAKGTGLIPKLDNTLPQGTYYLKEEVAPTGYNIMEQPIRFSVTSNGITVDNESASGFLTEKESLDGSHITYVISVPNTPTETEDTPYYFGIEKSVLIDKYAHGSGDAEQRFVFKVERFALDDTSYEYLCESFYVTLGCTEYADGTFTISNSTDGKFEYDSAKHTVTVNYGAPNSETYTFPADVRIGSQLICAKQPGLYRITEVTDWSKTDYTFWKGSNKIKDGTGTAAADAPVVKLTVDDNKKKPIACFANSEGEYAYLTSQSWAGNEITKEAS